MFSVSDAFSRVLGSQGERLLTMQYRPNDVDCCDILILDLRSFESLENITLQNLHVGAIDFPSNVKSITMKSLGNLTSLVLPESLMQFDLTDVGKLDSILGNYFGF